MEALREFILSLPAFILSLHDPSLVKPEESPNGNKIYHIYGTGELTEQKGGFAYRQRLERIVRDYHFQCDYSYLFPLNGYAIVTYENGIKILQIIAAHDELIAAHDNLITTTIRFDIVDKLICAEDSLSVETDHATRSAFINEIIRLKDELGFISI